MIVLVVVVGIVVATIAALLLLTARDRRHGHRMRSADDVARQVEDARRSIREAEDWWHQNQILGRRARGDTDPLRRSTKYPWLG